MRLAKYFLIAAVSPLALGAVSPAMAQTDGMPWVEMESTSFMLGFGGQSGDGMLRLPNLGTNCAYAFKVEGFGVGIQVGISNVTATGAVKNLTNVEDFAGKYSNLQGESTLIVGGGAMSLKNDANNVAMDLKSRTQGIGLGVGAQGLTITLVDPIMNAPRSYVVHFGFNNDWVSDRANSILNAMASAWKCRYVNFEVVGHTDSVGKEDKNLELSDKRAKNVRDYLYGLGIAQGRIFTRAAGESELQVPTGQGVAEPDNRVVVITVK